MHLGRGMPYHRSRCEEGGIAVNADSYEPPVVTDIGAVTEVALGEGADDTADMNTARYW